MRTAEDICRVNPEFVPGDGPGHFMPGFGLMASTIPMYWVLLSRYYKSVGKGSSYRFDGRLMNLTLPFLPFSLSLEAAILFVIGPAFAIAGMTYNSFRNNPGSILGLVIQTATDVHGLPFYGFALYCVTTVLANRKSLQIPENCPQMLLFFAYTAFACDFYGHLLTKCEYEVEMHRFFIFFPTILATLSVMGQLWYPDSFLVATSAIFWTYATGAGYVAVSFLAYYYSKLSLHWRQMVTHDKVKHIPPYFAVYCVLNVTFFMLLFILFGLARGRRLGADNPEYKRRRDDEFREEGEYTPLKVSDEENVVYSSDGKQ